MRTWIMAVGLVLAASSAEAAWVADLTWTSSPVSAAKPVTGTRLTRQVGTGTPTVIAPSVAPGTVAFTDLGPLTIGTTYTWCAIEFGPGGDGPSVCGSRVIVDKPAGVTNFGIQLRDQ